MVKAKPLAHKEDNTFRFESFNERLAKVKVSSLHHLERRLVSEQDLVEDSQTNFAETLVKWHDFNCSDDFHVLLKRRIGSILTVQTLPQLLLRKTELVEILKDNLNLENKALDVTLELTSALANDLKSDYYPFFDETFDILVGLTKSKDPQILENVFVCLVHLLKALGRYVIKDFDEFLTKFAYRLLNDNQPDYVRDFAAQSFAFLIRKVTDKKKVIVKIFSLVKENGNLATGMGHLCSDVLRGVRFQLHTCAESFADDLLELWMRDEWIGEESVNTTVKATFSLAAEFVSKENSGVLWQCIYKNTRLNSMTATWPQATLEMLDIVYGMINYRKGRLLLDPNEVCLFLADMIPLMYSQNQKNYEPSLEQSLKCASKLMKLSHRTLALENLRKLSNVIFSPHTGSRLISQFVEQLYQYPMFDRDVLPPLTVMVEKHLLDEAPDSPTFEAFLISLVKLIKERCTRQAVYETKPVNFVFNFSSGRVSDLLLKLISEYGPSMSGRTWCALRCLPHVRPILEKEKFCGVLNKFYLDISSTLLEEGCAPSDVRSQQAALLNETLQVLCQFGDDKVFSGNASIKFFFTILEKYPANISVLQSLDAFLMHAKERKSPELKESENFETVFNCLKSNLSSPSSVTRLLSCHILSLFDVQLAPQEDRLTRQKTQVFHACFQAENVEVTMETYREKLKYLNNLDCSHVDSMIPVDGTNGASYGLAPLRFLLGSLYVNLSVMWKPIENLIESYVRNHKNSSGVRALLIEHFERTEELISSAGSVVEATSEPGFFTFQECMNGYINELNSSATDRPDHFKHRQNLLDAFQKFADFLEPTNRHFVEFFLRYIEQQICPVDTTVEESREDVTTTTPPVPVTSNSDASEPNESVSKVPKTSKARASWKTVIAYMKVFANFKNPKAVFKEPVLTKLYYDFLKYPDADIQGAALKCLGSYSLAYLNPYKDRITRLLDEKNFRDELASFNLNPKCDDDIVVKDDHRENLLPIVMRILYGRMLSRTGGHSSGKGNAQLRRSLVFRFLAGCKDNEVEIFNNLALTALSEFVAKPYTEMIEAIHQIDVKRCVPVRRVHAALKTLTTILQYMGSLSKTLLPFLYKNIVATACYTSHLLSGGKNGEALNDSAVSQLKALRSDCFKVVIKFFNTFDTYSFEEQEIKSLFKGLILPLLLTFEKDCVTSPTPLLKLFASWSENSRFFPLLTFSASKDENGQTPFEEIIKIFVNEKVHSTVMEVIGNILENLITLSVHEKMQLDSGVQETEDFLESIKISEGIQIILPYVPTVLKKYKSNIYNSVKGKNKKNKIKKQDLVILSGISHSIDKQEECSALAELLLEALYRSFKSYKETATEFLLTIQRLAEKSGSNVDNLVRFLCPLFDILTENSMRRDICELLVTFSRLDSSYEQLARHAQLLNAVSYRCIDEPDYEKRFEGFREIFKILDDGETMPNIRFFEMVVYNSCFMLRESSDMALKDAATSAIERTIRKIIEADEKALISKICIDLILFREVKAGIRHSKEGVRHEFINILIFLLKYGREKHSTLQQLAVLCNDDKDQDFWERSKHIQSHARTKAFNKLAASGDETLSKISSEVLISFVLPVPVSTVNDVRNVKTNLVTASIELVGAIAHSLSWHHYEILLRQYLKLLTAKENENLPSTVRVISAILTNFNFDLTNARNDNTNEGDLNTSTNRANASDSTKAIITTACSGPLDEATATRIFAVITKKLLPALKKCLYEMSFTDFERDDMKKEHPEDEQMQRIPIAIAVVNLLLALPPRFKLLERNLPGIFLRLCHFLKSRAESVRESARRSLLKVMQALGHGYFPFLLKELKSTLSRGYQLHVLAFTVHSLLVNMSDNIAPGGLDNCLESITDICTNDILGETASEKEVGKIVAKLKEAKKSKSFDTYYLLGTFVGETSISKLVIPLQKLLSRASNHKVVKKVTICLQKLMLGLAENQALSEETLLKFIQSVASEHQSQFQGTSLGEGAGGSSSGGNDGAKKKSLKRGRSDCLLIAPERPRGIKPVKTTPTTNLHILVEQVFQLLHNLLKKERLSKRSDEHLALLGPFVALLTDYLSFKESKLVSAVLRCLQNLLAKVPELPELRVHCNRIKTTLFLLIEELSGSGSREGDRLELLVLCFKTMSSLLRDLTISDTHITEEQLCVLLSHIDANLSEDCPKPTTFLLLKAVLTRKLKMIPQLETVMGKVMQFAVQAEVEHIRAACSQTSVKYLLEYPHGKQLKGHVVFFARQLEYQMEFGRESALRVLNSLIKAFPRKLLETYQAFLFVPLASRLINEESPKCKKLVAAAIQELVARVSEEKRDDIFNEILIPWLQRSDLLQRRLAMHVMAIFADAAEGMTEKRLAILLPLVRQQLDPLRYADEAGSLGESAWIAEDGEEPASKRQQADHFIYQNLSTFAKLLRLKPELVRSSPWAAENTNAIWDSVYRFYLLYPHAWVRLISVELLGILFLHYTPEELAEAAIMNNGETNLTSQDYLLHDTEQKLSGLAKGFFKLMQNIYQVPELGEQIVKNLAFVAKTIIRLEGKGRQSRRPGNDEEEEDAVVGNGDGDGTEPGRGPGHGSGGQDPLSLRFMLQRLNKEIRAELAVDEKRTERRLWSFKLMAAIVVESPQGSLLGKADSGLLEPLMMPLVREVSDKKNQESSDESIVKLVLLGQQVLDLIKSIIGEDEFGLAYATTQIKLRQKRMERKKEKALQLVQDPEKGVKLKQKKHLKNKLAKKRKYAEKRGSLALTKQGAKKARLAAQQ